MKINELKAEIVRNGLTIESFAEKAGITRTTMWRRFNNPDELTLGEITTMADVLNLKGDRVIDIFFNDKVS
jgi:transcriptional regulator with XRE-family HTH domain